MDATTTIKSKNEEENDPSKSILIFNAVNANPLRKDARDARHPVILAE